ncbi:MAG: DUF1659 domain-containing protein [Firmicutes bacterium]|nr:DUF1659 domain-containing protein [Bacillota bacterium]
MAVRSVATGSVLRMQLQIGVDGKGAPVYRNKNLNNVKPGAADQELFDVAQALAGLQTYTLAGVLRVNTVRLEEAG